MNSRAKAPVLRSAALVALVAVLLRRPASAEDSISYKFENYREEDNRITVETQVGEADQDIGVDTHIKLTGTVDAISGATPTGQPAPQGSDQVVLSEMHERRKAWSGDLSHQFGNVSIDAGFADSRESDYVSRGWSVSALADFNEKNTTVRAGVAGTDDQVEVFFEPAYLPKQTHDAILGLTQILDPHTFVTLNLSWGRATGYLSEQRKIVEKSIEIVPGFFLSEAFGENRPNMRDRGDLYAAIDRSFPRLSGSLEASYRFYADTFGVVANTLEAGWFQHISSKLVLHPTVRLYEQGAANFYYYNLDDTNIIPVHVPNGTGPFYSSDYRLSRLDTVEYGLKAIWSFTDWLDFDVAYAVYAMHGRDGVTPQSAYPTAGITTLGIKFSW